MEKIKIQANLSVDRCGGPDKLPIVIEKAMEAIAAKYPDADIAVRKGYFQTIDGIWASDPAVERDIYAIIESVRVQVR